MKRKVLINGFDALGGASTPREVGLLCFLTF